MSGRSKDGEKIFFGGNGGSSSKVAAMNLARHASVIARVSGE
jgi:hypothetical protein